MARLFGFGRRREQISRAAARSGGRACPRCSRFQGLRRLACFLKFGCRGPLSASVRTVRITPKIPLSLPWVDTLCEGLNGLYEHLALWSACQCLLFTTIISSLELCFSRFKEITPALRKNEATISSN